MQSDDNSLCEQFCSLSSQTRDKLRFTISPESHEALLDPLMILTLSPTGGFLARTIRLSTTTLKLLYLAHLNLVTFCFYLLDTFWQNFSEIDLPGGGGGGGGCCSCF